MIFANYMIEVELVVKNFSQAILVKIPMRIVLRLIHPTFNRRRQSDCILIGQIILFS
jgi:hypothetical protein